MSKKMIVKIISALVVIAIVIPPLYFGGNFLLSLMAIIAAGASYETARLLEHKSVLLATILNFEAVMTMYFVPENFVASVSVLWLVVLFVIELMRGEVATDNVVYPFALTFLIGMALRCVRNIYSGSWTGWMVMVFVALACFLCDTGAYFFGVFFGKHKMIPAVSPNKTWEGSIGGYFTGFIGSLLFAWFMLPEMPKAFIITAASFLPLVAQVGDLSFSSIKRRFGIKDFGNLIPEHGGFLDRVDSLIFCLMVFNALMLIFGVM